MSDWVFTSALPEAEAISVHTRLEGFLEELGVATSLFEAGGASPFWELSIYATEENRGEVQALLAEQFAALPFLEQLLPETDWVARSLEGLKPVRAGRFLVHGSHDRDARRVGDTAIEIEAGQAFGTGHHGTTAGCLEAIEAVLKRGRPQTMLDVGTGSGVLAIALAKRTRLPVVATDIDPVAVRIARSNAVDNGVGRLVRPVIAIGTRHSTIAQNAPYDLVVANILAGPLARMARELSAMMAAGGTLILSGLLTHQRARIVSAYRTQGLILSHAYPRGEWLTLAFSAPGHGAGRA